MESCHSLYCFQASPACCYPVGERSRNLLQFSFIVSKNNWNKVCWIFIILRALCIHIFTYAPHNLFSISAPAINKVHIVLQVVYRGGVPLGLHGFLDLFHIWHSLEGRSEPCHNNIAEILSTRPYGLTCAKQFQGSWSKLISWQRDLKTKLIA